MGERFVPVKFWLPLTGQAQKGVGHRMVHFSRGLVSLHPFVQPSFRWFGGSVVGKTHEVEPGDRQRKMSGQGAAQTASPSLSAGHGSGR